MMEVRTRPQAGTQRQEPRQRPRRTLLICLLMAHVLSQLSYATQEHQPGDDITSSGLNPLTSVLNQENAGRAWWDTPLFPELEDLSESNAAWSSW